MHDVIVVGAGCVGSFAARILAEKGFDVLVLDKDREVGESVICSGIIGTDAFSSFDLPEESIQNKFSTMTVFGPSGRSVDYCSPDPFAYIVDRTRFDQMLAKRARESKVAYSMETFVEGVIVEEHGVNLRVQIGRERKTLRGKACILATGLGGKKFSIPGIGEIRDAIQGVQLEAEMTKVKNPEIYLGRKVAPGSFAWVVPAENGMCKVGLLARNGGAGLLRKFLEFPSVAERLQGRDGKIKAKMIPLAPITKSYTNRLLIMGEAAGQTKITTGGGIYYGLICAKIGTEVLERAFENTDFSEESMAPYEVRWKSLLGDEQRIGSQLLRIFSKLSDLQVDSVIELARADGIKSMADRLFRFDWHAPFVSRLLKNQLRAWSS